MFILMAMRSVAPGSRGYKIKAVNIDTEEIRIYFSIYKASKDLKIAKSAICSQVHTGCKNKTCKKMVVFKI